MNRNPADDRSALAVAWSWATRTMVIAAEMVVPGLAGYWIDTRLGTRIIFMLAGFAGGMTLALMHLLKIAARDNAAKTPPQAPSSNRDAQS